MTSIHYVCTECGSDKVEMTMWVNPNTDEITERFGSGKSDDTQYCHECDSPTFIKEERHERA